MTDEAQNTLVVELDEAGGDPLAFEVKRIDLDRISITLTPSDPEDEDIQGLTIVAAAEDVQFEIDRAMSRISRPPMVNPELDQPYSAPLDVVVIAKRVGMADGFPDFPPTESIQTLARKRRALMALREGRPVFHLEAQVSVPRNGVSRGLAATLMWIPGSEVTRLSMTLAAKVITDSIDKLA